MKVYSTKMDSTPHHVLRVAHDVKCTIHFFGVNLHPLKNCYSYHLI